MAFSDAHAVRQNIAALDAEEAIGSAITHYQKALQYGTYGDETIRASLAGFTLDAYRVFGRNAPGFADRLLPFAIQEARSNIAEHPQNYLYYYHLARLYNIQYLLTGTADEAIERLTAEGEKLGPERLELPLASAQLALLKKDFDAAVALSEYGIARNKRFADFYRVAFLAYNLKGDAAKARWYLEEGVKNGLVLLPFEEQWLK